MKVAYSQAARDAELRNIIAEWKLNLHDVWNLAMMLSEKFDGMIKFTGVRVVLHVKQKHARRR